MIKQMLFHRVHYFRLDNPYFTTAFQLIFIWLYAD